MNEPRGAMTAAEMIEWIDTHPPLPTHTFMEPCGQDEGTDHCWFCGAARAPHPVSASVDREEKS